MIKKRKKGLFIPRIVICVILTMVMMSNCDTLEDDAVKPVTVTKSGQGMAVLDGQSTVIDLKSSLAVTVPVKTEIVRQPSFGMLSSLGEGLYKYTPDENESGKQDIIGYNISDLDNNVLASDSIIIDIVDQLPDSCQLIAIPDVVSVDSDSVYFVSVLSNDFVCDSLLPIELSVVKQPQFGQVDIENNGIVYFSTSNSQVDELVYQIVSTKDDSFSSLATVSFVPQDSSCVFQLEDDMFDYTALTGGQRFEVLANDNLCNDSEFELSITESIVNGQAFFDENNSLNVTINDTFPAGSRDSLVYQVCINGVCKSATVTFTLFGGGDCDSFSLNDDSFENTSSMDEQLFEVLANDQLCNTDSAFEIGVIEGPFNGQAFFDANNTLNYLYATGSADSLTYQVCYGNNCKTATVTFTLVGGGDCDSFSLNDDSFENTSSTAAQFFEVLANDQLCNTDSAFEIGVIEGPFNGQAFFDANNTLNYLYSTGSSDSLTYQVCYGNNCKSAVVRLKLEDNDCNDPLMAVDDVYSIPDSTQTSFQVSLDVTANDVLCGVYFIDIEQGPTIGGAQVDGTTIIYTTNASNPGNDSFQYRLCNPDTDTCDIANVTIER